MGQALIAASKSVSEINSDFLLHSFHCYFVGPTQSVPAVTYKVDHAKDGKNFCSLSVRALQGDKVNFHCMASFYKHEGSVVTHEGRPMPDVPKPGEPLSSSSSMISLLGYGSLMQNNDGPLEMLLCVDDNRYKKFLAKEAIEPR